MSGLKFRQDDVVRIAHQVAVKVGDAIGNTYPVLEGLKPGDKVITSGLQFLAEGMPVKPLS